MKKVLFSAVAVLCCLFLFQPAAKAQVKVDSVNFPDAEFRSYILKTYVKDTLAFQLSASECTAVKAINVSGKSQIKSLKGMEKFTALEDLDCSGTSITELSFLNNKEIRNLRCADTKIKRLDLSKLSNLVSLDCRNTPIAYLNLKNNNSLVSDNFLYGNHAYEVKMYKGYYLTLSSIPAFDTASASDWKGADYANGEILVNKDTVTYKYKTQYKGNDKKFPEQLAFSIVLAKPDSIVAKIDAVTFPNPNFRKYVMENIDTNKDTLLQDNERMAVTALSFTGSDINSFKGLEYFIALEQLEISNNNKLKSALDLSSNRMLKEVRISKDSVASINVSRNFRLERLDVDSNVCVSALNVSKNTALKELSCNGTPVAKLDLTANTALKVLRCNSSAIRQLDVAVNTALEELSCAGTAVTSLDLSNNTALKVLNITGMPLAYIDLSANTALTTLVSGSNVYPVYTRDGAKTFDLSKIPGFKTANMSGLNGGSVEGDILTITGDKVTYQYKIDYAGSQSGVPQTVEFALQAGTDLLIDAVNFPDPAFREYVKYFDDDEDLRITFEERLGINELNLSGKPVVDLTGVECFEQLTHLYLNKTLVEDVDVRRCTRLIWLEVQSDTVLKSINVEGLENISNLNVNASRIKELSLNNASLKRLHISGTKITEIDLTALPGLMGLECNGTPLSYLDLSGNKNMKATLLNVSFWRRILAEKGGQFDLTQIEGFDVSRAKNWDSATINGNVITILGKKVTYECETGYTGNDTVPATIKFVLIPSTQAEIDAAVEKAQLKAPFKVWSSKGYINLSGTKGTVEVFNMKGVRVYRGNKTQIALPAQGIYIVRNQGYAVKVFGL